MPYKELLTILKILSSSSRLEILDLLSRGELRACDLLEHFQFLQPILSHHMKSLVDNELVTTRKDGNKHWCQLNYVILDDIIQNSNIINTSNQKCICKNVEPGDC